MFIGYRNYPELAFFEGDHCQHVADWQDMRRVARVTAEIAREIRRNLRGKNNF